VRSTQGDAVKAFLAATAKGYKFAAENPTEAAKVFLKAVADEAYPLAPPLDEKLVEESHAYNASHFLSKDGRWGVMDEKVWDAFLDWLSDTGLLTTKVQSRAGASDTTTSLDGLRSGDVGERIPREQLPASQLFTNAFLS